MSSLALAENGWKSDERERQSDRRDAKTAENQLVKIVNKIRLQLRRKLLAGTDIKACRMMSQPSDTSRQISRSNCRNSSTSSKLR